MSATLLEKENELSKIQRELKILEPYRVGSEIQRQTVQPDGLIMLAYV